MHGLLHLLGFDHEAGAEEAAAMERAERHILGCLGWQARPGAGLSRRVRWWRAWSALQFCAVMLTAARTRRAK